MHLKGNVPPVTVNRAAFFLDSYGVINVDKHCVHRVNEFVFVDGIFGLCCSAAVAGLVIAVVTNQAGIGRGYYMEVRVLLVDPMDRCPICGSGRAHR